MADGGRFGFEIAIDDKATPTLRATTAQMQSLEKTGIATGAKVGTSFATMAKSFVAAAGGAMLLSRAWGAMTSLGRTALKNAAEQVEANAKLQFLYGENARALTEQATALQLTTRFGDDYIQGAQFALGTYKLSVEAVRELTPAILDMAQATGADATSAAKLIGKAMSGNATVLSRYGIMLSQAQKDVLALGTEEEKVAVITTALGSKFGGIAEAMANTVPGAITQAKNAWGDYLEAQGMAIQESERVRVGIAAVARELLGAANAAQDTQGTIDGIALSFANAAVSVTESITPMVRWGGVLKNVTDMAITISTLNFGDVFELPASVKSDWSEMQSFMSSDFGSGIADSARRIRDEMAAVKAGSKSAVMPMRRGAFGAPGENESAGGKSGAGPSGYTDDQFAGEVAKWEAMDAQIADTDFAWAVTRLERQEQLAQDFADRQFEAEVRAWEERDRMAEEHARAHGELAGRYLGYAIDATGKGLADTIVDGKAAWNDLWKNALKGAVAMTAEMLIQLAIAKAIGAAIGGATGGPVGAFVGALFHDGGMIDRYHSGGTIPRAHSGMYTGRLRRDEVPIIAQTGEAVLNRSATARIGGRSGVDALNRGGGIGGGINITIHAAPGQSATAIADSVGRELMRRSRRGEIVINARGVEQ